ncbi:MAG: type IV toxin-antitoxin system AbiEi family antitoxin [Hydrogenovibrio sp.]|uniref:type IV toxin-antitoxin system AbiEi family antitoxin n=1 Tax=Hydrogenovibrio sp. TaxID=2065821 RepID=UPI0028705D82|nr:type IV toxin-antitoxin system AbiEi family antitoxin [Hydrogenovibrio sp.]MDR9500104.1 type IV toxin-antitoxin system AbiEi family antitoxin [Hydrogenovibrio sp.]
MKTLLNETRLLEKALNAFSCETGVVMSLVSGRTDQVRLEGMKSGFRVWVKPSVTRQNVHAIMHELSKETTDQPTLVVSRYINPNIMDLLREARVSCIDTAGNGFIVQPPVYICVKGNKPTAEAAIGKSGRAFQYAGLKVVFSLLQEPDLIEKPYREIAERAQVALGSIGWILSDLIEGGYVQKSGRKRHLIDKERLLQKWVEHYPALKQKHFLGAFTTESVGWWKHIDIVGLDAVWGGEIAAEIDTHYLQAKDGVVYVNRAQMAEFIKVARLKKRKPHDSEAIRIDLVEPFWHVTPKQRSEGLAPVLLVYADLIHSNDARNLETANRLYAQLVD